MEEKTESTAAGGLVYTLVSPWDNRLSIIIYDVTKKLNSSTPLYSWKLSKRVWSTKYKKHIDAFWMTEKDMFFCEDLIHRMKEKLAFLHSPAFGKNSKHKLVELADPEVGNYPPKEPAMKDQLSIFTEKKDEGPR
jgi:hypothetical protein